MVRQFLCIGVMVTIANIGVAAIAQPATPDTMHMSKMMMPTMVCRAANKGEAVTATLATGGGIVCKSVDMASMMKAPATSSTTSKADEDAAWQRQLQFLTMESN